MSKAAVRAYVLAQLQAIVWPVASSTFLTAYDTTPKGEPLTDMAIILGITSNERRRAMGRPGGGKRIDYTVDVMLNANDGNPETAVANLDQIEWRVKNRLRTIALPVTIADATNGESSTVIEIGEDLNILADWTEDLSDEGTDGEVRAYEVIQVRVWEDVVPA